MTQNLNTPVTITLTEGPEEIDTVERAEAGFVTLMAVQWRREDTGLGRCADIESEIADLIAAITAVTGQTMTEVFAKLGAAVTGLHAKMSPKVSRSGPASMFTL